MTLNGTDTYEYSPELRNLNEFITYYVVSNPYALGTARIVRTTDTQIVIDKPYFTGVARFKIFLDNVFIEENKTCLYIFNNLDANKDYRVKIEVYYPNGDVKPLKKWYQILNKLMNQI